ncbi:MarR family winged helix-turn-helix transcriptional regulator [Sphingomonas nostoxanthinifaciens]|uniref:MarR family winged helix-turn-helix transcriptional regulator n=1 Tax=Sphingomonas nostoxanthinifaciens TaxID=2872652 RepID=UPI001CC203C7|nr:MarR family winged helix-turn-helix transcriptional regulator [Sphingomonas nostoxanthinifaciens]UAK25130.1 MarR family winged helix-turn-helix transcriptional regulator [Sphingomonas nostoxanthinifaciens]
MPDSRTFDPSSANFRLGHSPFYLIAHADFKYHEDMSLVLAKNGVTKSIYRLMTVLREGAPMSIGALAASALIKRSTASRIVERMLDQGLVATELNREDNRVTEVALTASGTALLARLTPVVNRQLKRAIEGVPETDLDALVRTLQQMVANLSKLPIE